MKVIIVLVVSVVLLHDVSGWWFLRSGHHHPHRQQNSHHSVSSVSSTFTSNNCDCSPQNFTRDVATRALDVNGDGQVDEREAADVLNQLDDAPSLEDLKRLMELESLAKRKVKTFSKTFKTSDCCVSTVHHSVIDSNSDGKVSEREAGRMLNMEEDHPGLRLFMHHADTKRDGMVDVQEFRDAVNQLQFCKLN